MNTEVIGIILTAGGVLAGFVGGVVAILAQKRIERRETRTNAALALRFEIEMDRHWLAILHKRKLWLREATMTRLQSDGVIFLLGPEVVEQTMVLYTLIHSFHQAYKPFKEGTVEEPPPGFDKMRQEIAGQIGKLNRLLDPFLKHSFGRGLAEGDIPKLLANTLES